MLHDIGKLVVPPKILNKPGKPDADEWATLQQHPGAAIERLGALGPWLGDWGRSPRRSTTARTDSVSSSTTTSPSPG